MKMQKEYFIGLDVGTESVGWAVTDVQYNLLKCNGKSLWGVRLFNEAQNASERRAYRTARRRLDRSQQRLQWLQGIFAEEIAKKDPAFFQRLKLSKYILEDKNALSDGPIGKHLLFTHQNYTDRDFYKSYPTIYHLRYALIDNKTSPFDVRLVYLAIHHILKHRGHFLFDSLASEEAFKGPEALKEAFNRLNSWLENNIQNTFENQLEGSDESTVPSFSTDSQTLNRLTDILKNKKLGITKKHEQLLQCLNISKSSKQLSSILKLIAGGSVNLNSLYNQEIEGEIKTICLKDWEQSESKLNQALGERMELVLSIKQIYDFSLLAEILGEEKYISCAKMKIYEKHMEDLKRLKSVIKRAGDGSPLYKEIFRDAKDKLDNYSAYSGHGAANYKCSYDKFKTYLKKKLSELPQDEEIKDILTQLDSGTFLPKQITKDNSIIPHQIHELELRRILENASGYLPFLNETDSSGLTRKEQILRVFLFRIPYYVGPLNSHSPFSWIVRKGDKIEPWNFDEIVDLEKCAENFITRMTAKCSYTGQDVLPKDSLLYSRFTALNELNNLRINGQKPPVEIKQKIYNEHLMLKKGKNIKSYLQAEGLINDNDQLSGIDGNIKSTLASCRAFSWLTTRPGGQEAAEELIKRIVLFSSEKKLLAQYITKTYSHLLNQREQQQVLNMKFSGWGRLSKEFLTQIYHIDKNTGECINIIDALWSTNDNLNELLSSRYTFKESLENYLENLKLSYSLDEYLEQSYASPSIRRAIRQTIAIVNEIEHIMRRPPKRIFLEMTRGEDEKPERTISRKDALLNIYKNCTEEADSLFQSLEARSEAELRRDKLYLYYTQLGKCMYSGKEISLSELEANYDIDHIYPQSLTKDDSLNNRVLVKRELNAKKGDVFPLSQEIREQMAPFWKKLNEKKLISDRKYERLMRHTPLTDQELAGFIQRQLVETSQSAKIIAELLKKRYDETQSEIVYVKAGNVSSFRQEQRIDSQGRQRQAGQCRKNEHTSQDPVFIKCREVNDLHHAKDAYLNIVSGNVYHVKFTKNPLNFILKANKRAGSINSSETAEQTGVSKGSRGYSLNRVYDFDVERNGEMAWTAGENGSISVVRRTMTKNNILFTRFSYEQKGGFFDLTILRKGKGQHPIKANMDINTYGGYDKRTGAYYFLVEHQPKKKRVCSIEAVFSVHRNIYENNPLKYCEEILELNQPRIIIPKIKIDSLFCINGARLHISGRTGDNIVYKNASQLILAPQWNAYIKKVLKYLERCKAAKKELENTVYDGISAQENIQLYQILLDKLSVPQYAGIYTTPRNVLEKGAERFQALSLTKQCEIISQILLLFACKANTINLELLDGAKNTGKVIFTKNLNEEKFHIQLIHQSVTGVFEKRIDILTGQNI